MKKIKIIFGIILAVCVLAAILYIVGVVWAEKTQVLSDEDLQQDITQAIIQDVQKVFDEKPDLQLNTCQVEFASFDQREKPKFSLEYEGFIDRGLACGDITILIDCPTLYPYLEKNYYQYDDLLELNAIGDALRDELRGNSYMVSGVAGNYYYGFDFERDRGLLFLDSEGNEYYVHYMETDNLETGHIDKNGETVYSCFSGGSGGTCSMCNGTGVMKFNYGSSDLEAVLSGNDPYTYGPCSSCGGTGKG